DATESLLDHGYKELAIPATAYQWFRLSPHALHIWPRSAHMLIALPNLHGDFTATLFLANDDQPGFSELVTEDDVAKFFAAHYPNVSAFTPDLVVDFLRNPVGIMGTVRCRHWHIDGDVLLIGDAAHAIVPFHGQGMNAALEDCWVFEQLFQRIGPDWATLFATFEHKRRVHTNAIATMALENYEEMRETVRDPAFHVRKALAFALERELPERFVTRYAMVMFRPDIGYADAQRRGALQAQLLHEFSAGVDSVDDIDLARAIAVVKERLAPL
ncbi:MAG: FAD-dependent monooxygenase, partial [Pseudomonadota bacterium]